MNCQPGDMALVILGPSSGTMVTCQRLLEGGETMPTSTGIAQVIESGITWLIDRQIIWFGGRLMAAANDCWLLPIRPERDEDLEETERQSGVIGHRVWLPAGHYLTWESSWA